MIDLSTETIVSLRDAAKLLPPARQGRAVSFQCVLRWVLNGARDPEGQLVRLEAIRLGGRWLTSREALQRFGERLTPPGKSLSGTRTVRQRRRAAERAEKELEKLGM
jgi:hypothetical protein